MKPRIFVSSTYYDLKYVRESLERFIRNYDFEPVLFESGNVLFEPHKKIDDSCYNEVSICHMMMLIIGGRYGSLASGEEQKEKEKEYDKSVVSITRKEYETAINNKIPTFIFVDKNVYSEYQTYIKNKPNIDLGLCNIEYAFVDSINVFKFIDLVSSTAIKTFEKIEEIEIYLKQQISAMFYQYLESLQNKAKESKVLDAVSELKGVSESMNVMVQELGKHILTQSDNTGYERVIEKQNQILIEFYVDSLKTRIKIRTSTEYDFINAQERDFRKYAEDFYTLYLNSSLWNNYEEQDFKEYERINQELSTKLVAEFCNQDANINSLSIEYGIIQKYKSVIEPAIRDNQKLIEIFLDKLTYIFYLEIGSFPF